MVNIAVARVMVSFVERADMSYRPDDDAALAEAGLDAARSGGIWQRLRLALSGRLTAARATATTGA